MDRTETTRSRWRKMKITRCFCIIWYIYIQSSESPRRPPGCNEESPSVARGSIYFREKCLPPSFALWFGPTCLWNGSCRAQGENLLLSLSSFSLFHDSVSFLFSFLFFSFSFLSRPFPLSFRSSVNAREPRYKSSSTRVKAIKSRVTYAFLFARISFHVWMLVGILFNQCKTSHLYGVYWNRYFIGHLFFLL